MAARTCLLCHVAGRRPPVPAGCGAVTRDAGVPPQRTPRRHAQTEAVGDSGTGAAEGVRNLDIQLGKLTFIPRVTTSELSPAGG